MKRRIGRKVMGALFLIIIFPAYTFGQGEQFPVKPINLYVGYAPGGSGSTTGQAVADGMKKYLNQPVILNFKPGANQAVVAEFIKNSKPDGYTLLYLSHAHLIAKVTKDRRDGVPLKFQMDDLDCLGAAPYSPGAIVVNAESPWRTLEDFIAAARKSPGSLNYGSSGIGSAWHLLEELFSLKAGIVLNHIPFQGAAPALTALLGGHVQIAIFDMASLGSQVKPGGGLRPLAVFDKKRYPTLPDVPTTLEKGYDIVFSTWFGLRGPRELSKPVRASLIDAFGKAIKDPQVISLMSKLECNLNYLTPEEQDKKSREEYKLFLDVWEKVSKK